MIMLKQVVLSVVEEVSVWKDEEDKQLPVRQNFVVPSKRAVFERQVVGLSVYEHENVWLWLIFTYPTSQDPPVTGDQTSKYFSVAPSEDFKRYYDPE